MKIIVNGEERVFDDGITVAMLIEALGIQPKGIAVEVNREIIPKNSHNAKTLIAGDKVEIIRMTGGGF